MEEERWVSEEAIRVSAERQARVVAVRVERERQVEVERRAADEEAAWMEAERRAAAMKCPLEFIFRLCPINFSLEFSLR